MAKAQVQNSSPSRIRPLEAITHLLSFAVLSCAFLPLIANIPATVGGLGLWFLYVVFYVSVVAALMTTLTGRGSKSLRVPLRVTTAIVGLALIILGIGLVQDNAGVWCTGFFGVKQACIDGARFAVGFWLFNPLVFVPAAIILTVIFAKGLYDIYRGDQVIPKKNTK